VAFTRNAALAVLLVTMSGACTGEIAGAGGPDARPVATPDAGGPPPELDSGVPEWMDGDQLVDRACPEGSIVSYQNFAAGFFAEYCTGCHSAEIPANMRHDAPMDVNFNTLTQVEAHADAIYREAADGYRYMPPAGGPSPEARALLGEWLACGMIE
jgi:hypothetical protein